jgi:hypothetical protein
MCVVDWCAEKLSHNLQHNPATYVAAHFQRRVSCIAVVLVDHITILRWAVERLAAWGAWVSVSTAPLGLQAKTKQTQRRPCYAILKVNRRNTELMQCNAMQAACNTHRCRHHLLLQSRGQAITSEFALQLVI